MRDVDLVDKREPASSSTLREEEWTAMSKLLKTMAPFCSIYDMGFTYPVED